MFKKKIYIVALLFISGFIILYLYNKNTYIEYQPLIFDGDHYKVQAIGNKKDFNNKLKKVLDYYHEDFKVSNEGNILIKKKLLSEKELLSNYTKKALDKNWSPTKK
ncbi:hypothetical protein [Chryseobacterium lactis]|nr:hypothetical protein [Chryseobacterium lactis]